MPEALIEDILAYGRENGIGPQQTAAAIRKWQSDVLNEGRSLKADPVTNTPAPDYWKGAQAVDLDVTSALQDLSAQSQLQKATELFPNPAERSQFLSVFESSSYDPEKMDAPPAWIESAREIQKAGDDPSFKLPRHQFGRIGFGPATLGIYSIREKEDGKGFEAVVQPQDKSADPLIVNLPDDDTIRTEKEADLTPKLKEINRILEETDVDAPFMGMVRDPSLTKRAALQNEQRLFSKGSLQDVLHAALTDKLKTNDVFLKTIRNDLTEQFTKRPLAELARSGAQAVAGSGMGNEENKKSLTAEGSAAVDVFAPGALRDRFTSEDGVSGGDMISSGISSLLTAVVPGGLARTIAAKTGAAAAGAVPFFSMTAEAPAVASLASQGSFFGTSYGSNRAADVQYADSLRSAGRIKEADRVLRDSQFTSLAKAAVDLGTERIFPDEIRAAQGIMPGIGRAVTMPAKEGFEEGVGALASNAVNAVSGDERTQDPIDAAYGGGVGAIPFLGFAGAQRLMGARQAQESGSTSEAIPPAPVDPYAAPPPLTQPVSQPPAAPPVSPPVSPAPGMAGRRSAVGTVDAVQSPQGISLEELDASIAQDEADAQAAESANPAPAPAPSAPDPIVETIAAAAEGVTNPAVARNLAETAAMAVELPAVPEAPVEQPATETAPEPAAVIAEPPAMPEVDQWPEVDLFGEPILPETSSAALNKVPIVDIPLSEIELSADVPNFKDGANERGVVAPLGGEFNRTGLAPVLIWERLNGKKELISGRHRFALAQDTNQPDIPAQIVREADGFTKQDAMMKDAELNIQDEKGTVRDFARYFRESNLTEAEAERRGLVARSPGKSGWAIGRNAGVSLFDLHSNKQIGDAAAVAIANTAPGNEELQRAGMRAVGQGNTIDFAVNLMRAAGAAQSQSRIDGKQLDLFGSDDSAMRGMEDQARAATAAQRALREQVSAVNGAVKRPEVAKQMGVDVKNPAAVQAKVDELKAELARWENWPLHPDLVARTLPEVSLKPENTDTTPEPVAETPVAETLPAEGNTPALSLDTETPEQIEAEKQRKSDRAKIEDRRNKPLKGNAGDMTPDLLDPGTEDNSLFTRRTDPASGSAAPIEKVRMVLQEREAEVERALSALRPAEQRRKSTAVAVREGMMSREEAASIHAEASALADELQAARESRDAAMSELAAAEESARPKPEPEPARPAPTVESMLEDIRRSGRDASALPDAAKQNMLAARAGDAQAYRALPQIQRGMVATSIVAAKDGPAADALGISRAEFDRPEMWSIPTPPVPPARPMLPAVVQSQLRDLGITGSNVRVVNDAEIIKEGWVERDNSVVLNAAWLGNPSDVISVLNHEASHIAERNPDMTQDFLDLHAALGRETIQRITELIPKEYDAASIPSEVNARVVQMLNEKFAELPAWKRVLQKLITWAKRDLGMTLNKADAMAIASRIVARGVQMVRDGVTGNDTFLESYSIVPGAIAGDAEYLAAVEAGDVEAQQRMVESAAKRKVEAHPRSVVAFGHFLDSEVHAEALSKIKPLPKDVFYVGSTEVIRNPENSDERRMRSEVTDEFGRDSSGDPLIRQTKDEFGNRWIWKSHKGMHSQIEPGITSREGVFVNQNNTLPDRTEQVKDAIREGSYIPEKTRDEFSRYSEFMKPGSSDPVTRDAADNVIPLSQRFDTRNNNINYSIPDAPGESEIMREQLFGFTKTVKMEAKAYEARNATKRALLTPLFEGITDTFDPMADMETNLAGMTPEQRTALSSRLGEYLSMLTTDVNTAKAFADICLSHIATVPELAGQRNVSTAAFQYSNMAEAAAALASGYGITAPFSRIINTDNDQIMFVSGQMATWRSDLGRMLGSQSGVGSRMMMLGRAMRQRHEQAMKDMGFTADQLGAFDRAMNDRAFTADEIEAIFAEVHMSPVGPGTLAAMDKLQTYVDRAAAKAAALKRKADEAGKGREKEGKAAVEIQKTWDQIVRDTMRDSLQTLTDLIERDPNTPRAKAIRKALLGIAAATDPAYSESAPELADFRKTMQERGGAALAKNFWQMMASTSRPLPGALDFFDRTTQNLLADMLRKAVDKAGLAGESVSIQPGNAAKIAANLSADPLRWDKIQIADKAVRDDIGAIEDPERRAAVLAAWEEATAGMGTALGGPSLASRAIRDELKESKPKWRDLFLANENPREAAAGVRRETVDAVMAKIDPMVQSTEARAKLPALRREIESTFDRITDERFLVFSEQQERARARKEQQALLRNQGIAEKTLKKFTDALDGVEQKPGEPAAANPVRDLIDDHRFQPLSDFVERIEALGVTRDVAVPLDAAIRESHAREHQSDLDKYAESLADSLMADPKLPIEGAKTSRQFIRETLSEWIRGGKDASDLSASLKTAGVSIPQSDALVVAAMEKRALMQSERSKSEAAAAEKRITETAFKWINGLAELHSDTWTNEVPENQRGKQRATLEGLIRAHLKEINPSFQEDAVAMGLKPELAKMLDMQALENHRRAAHGDLAKGEQRRAKQRDDAFRRIMDSLKREPESEKTISDKRTLATLIREYRAGKVANFEAQTRALDFTAEQASELKNELDAAIRKEEVAAELRKSMRNQGIAVSRLNRLDEWLNGTTSPAAEKNPNPVSDLIDRHIKKEIPDFVSQITALGVAPDISTRLAAAIEETRFMNSAPVRLMGSILDNADMPRMMQRNLKAGDLVKQFMKAPAHERNNASWRRDEITKWLRNQGIDEAMASRLGASMDDTVAEVMANVIFQEQERYLKAQKGLGPKADLAKFASKFTQNTDKIRAAIHAGLLNDGTPWQAWFSSITGIPAMTAQDTANVAGWESIISNDRYFHTEQGVAAANMRDFLARTFQKNPGGWELLAASYVASALSSIPTVTVQITAPMGRFVGTVALDAAWAIVSPGQSVKGVAAGALEAVRTWVNEVQVAWKYDTAGTYSMDIQDGLQKMSPLKRDMEIQAEIFNNPSTSFVGQTVALARFMRSMQDYFRQGFGAADTAALQAFSTYFQTRELRNMMKQSGLTMTDVENYNRANGIAAAAAEEEAAYLGYSGALALRYIQQYMQRAWMKALDAHSSTPEEHKQRMKTLIDDTEAEAEFQTNVGQKRDGMAKLDPIEWILGGSQMAAEGWNRKAAREMHEGSEFFGAVSTLGSKGTVGFAGVPINFTRGAMWMSPTVAVNWMNYHAWQIHKERNPNTKWENPYERSLGNALQVQQRGREAIIPIALTALAIAMLISRMKKKEEDEDGDWIVNGMGPDPSKHRQTAESWRKLHTPNSIERKNADGTYDVIPFSKGGIEWLRAPLSMMGGANDAILNARASGEEVQVSSMLGQAFKQLGIASMTTGIRNLSGFRDFTQKGSKADDLGSKIGFMAAPFIPYSGTERSIRTAVIPQRMEKGLANNLPLVPWFNDAKPQLNVYGDPVYPAASGWELASQLTSGAVPFYRVDRGDVNERVYGWSDKTGKYPTTYPRSRVEKDMARPMTDDEWRTYAEVSGRLRKADMIAAMDGTLKIPRAIPGVSGIPQKDWPLSRIRRSIENVDTSDKKTMTDLQKVLTAIGKKADAAGKAAIGAPPAVEKKKSGVRQQSAF